MRRMLREVPNYELTHAEHGCDDHSRGWRTYVAVICDYIMVSLGPSWGQRQHGGWEISFVSRRAARLPHPSTPSVVGEVVSSHDVPTTPATPYTRATHRLFARLVSHS